MNILILHSHLKEFLDTKAKAEKIGECLALSGPAVERVKPLSTTDAIYDIEITTNRVDTASVMGIAREAAAILPEFGIKANFKNIELSKVPVVKKSVPLTIKIDKRLNKRVLAVVMDVSVNKSPQWMQDRLEAAGIRSKNNLVDITNYVMLEVGHPTHVFDYDKIVDHTLIFRLSKKGETATTFDGKNYKLPGNDIVIISKNDEIIDLPGIIGTKNSVVSEDTKRIIFFIDNNDAQLMRKTSLNLGIRTMAVQLNEKNVDPELGALALNKGIQLYQKLAQGVVISKIHDYYPKPYKSHTISISNDEIEAKIGVVIEKQRVKKMLENLGFITKLTANKFIITVPSFRSLDIQIKEDIVEEIARIYGYHNLPSQIMTGALPLIPVKNTFDFERKIKQIFKGFGAHEVYTLSLVPKSYVGNVALKVKNPLGADTEFLRTTLIPSLLEAEKDNKSSEKFHLYEVSNVYLPQEHNLPEEALRIGGVFKGFSYREVKGQLDGLFEQLHIQAEYSLQDNSIEVTTNNDLLGAIERLSNNRFVYEFSVNALHKHSKEYLPYKPQSKYPAQVEDITLVLSPETKVGILIQSIKSIKNIQKVELKDIYKDSYTFRIWYHSNKKTLTDHEVEKIREKLTALVSKKFNGKIKV